MPHYDEDQEGDQEDAAEREQLPDAELTARLRG